MKSKPKSKLPSRRRRAGGTSDSPHRSGPVTQFDPTLPGRQLRLGRLHPITQTIEELKGIMGRLGFSVADGPEVEDEWHNFEAMNIPLEHPARDPLDNFYLSVAGPDRGHAAAAKPNQHRPDPRDGTDAAPGPHYFAGPRIPSRHGRCDPLPDVPPDGRSAGRPTGHDGGPKSVLRMFAASYLGSDVHIRFRPSFFPFTEPSVEADFSWNDQWIEFGGAGMVDPNVLQAVGYDPEGVTGLAFGLGVERLCMRRHNITDIRALYRNDVRFLQQF